MTITVGLLGCGVVGSAVARALTTDAESLAARVGAGLRLGRVAVLDPGKPRGVPLPPGALTTNSTCVATDLAVDVVVEAIGGIEPARTLVASALDAGKHVVTANKQLVAAHGPALHQVAAANGVTLRYEGAVCAGVPVLRVLEDALAGDRVLSLRGVLNGTTNFVLTRLGVAGGSLEEAVAEAGRLGYAEADSSDDLSGRDAAAKLVLLARAAFRRPARLPDVIVSGLDEQVAQAARLAPSTGQVVKLVAEAVPTDDGLLMTVAPRTLDAGDELASASGVDNVVVLDAERAGRLVLVGPGAGGPATASAVLGDVVAAARELVLDAWLSGASAASRPGEPAWP